MMALDALQTWIAHRLPDEAAKPPLKFQVDTLVQIPTQDLGPDPTRGRRGFATVPPSIAA